MRKVGIIGGISWVASERYYRLINLGVQRRSGAACSPPLVMDSLNHCDLTNLADDGDWERAASTLIASAQRLEAAGATALVIAANSMHRVADQIAAAITIPLIHIVDETGRALAAKQVRAAAVIGTRNVMTQRWYRQRLVASGVTLAPFDGGRAAEIDRIIYQELMQGVVSEDSRRTLRGFITDIAKQDIDALVLGSTELTMLVDPTANVLPIFDTTSIHAAAAVDWIMGETPA